MRTDDPIRNLLKEHKSSHRAVYDTLKKRLADTGGLSWGVWDWFDAAQQRYEPDVYAARMSNARRKSRLQSARELTIEDLEQVIKEKREGG